VGTDAAAERSRSYGWDDPAAFAAAAAGRSGLELMRAVVAGELPQAPMAATLGLRLVEASEGRAVFEGEPAEWHYNPIGTAHAGLALTLLDSAMGCAFVTTLPDAAVPWTTLELKGSFTRALTSESGVVRCTGGVLHAGRSVVTTEARVEDAAGRLCAHGTSTILVRR
jgi:uncharacterized protein (TIGR00369 family)